MISRRSTIFGLFATPFIIRNPTSLMKIKPIKLVDPRINAGEKYIRDKLQSLLEQRQIYDYAIFGLSKTSNGRSIGGAFDALVFDVAIQPIKAVGFIYSPVNVVF